MKNGCSPLGASCIAAVAALAAGLEVVVIVRDTARRVAGRRRVAVRSKDAMMFYLSFGVGYKVDEALADFFCGLN